jgi:hypothetical protein
MLPWRGRARRDGWPEYLDKPVLLWKFDESDAGLARASSVFFHQERRIRE